MASTINSDNGVVSGSVGLKYASDNSGVLALQTNGNTAVTITSANNVGIGTTSPANTLDVKGIVHLTHTTTGNSYRTLRASGFGYDQNSYGAVVLGSITGNVTNCIGVDPSSVSGGSFSGNGSEVAFRNAQSFITPNSGGTDWIPVMSYGSAGEFKFNSGYGTVATAYACRVWVQFNGSTGAINGSGNVTSVSKNGTGDYSVFFTNNMPDANYCYSVDAQRATNNNGDGPKCGVYYGGVQTGSIRVLIPRQTSSSGETYDTNWTNVSIAIFR